MDSFFSLPDCCGIDFVNLVAKKLYALAPLAHLLFHAVQLGTLRKQLGKLLLHLKRVCTCSSKLIEKRQMAFSAKEVLLFMLAVDAHKIGTRRFSVARLTVVSFRYERPLP